MQSVPEKVKACFTKVKKQYPFYIVLAPIRGKYYVYKRSSKWDKTTKKPTTISEYLGRITDDGQYIAKQLSYVTKKELASLPDMPSPEPTTLGPELNDDDKMLLQILSMNARADLSFLGKKLLNMKPSTVFYRVKQLEQKLGIKYLPEIDVTKLGYLPFIILIRFHDIIHDVKALKAALEQNPKVQLALLTKGRYDLIIYALAKNNVEINRVSIDIAHSIGSELTLHASPIEEDYGFVPLRTEFIESVEKEQLDRHKAEAKKLREEHKRERISYLPGELLEREYAVLKELSKNGAVSLSEIDEKYGLEIGRADYTYHKLKEKGILKRVTISMTKLPLRYVGVLLETTFDIRKFMAKRAASLKELLERSNSIADRYVLADDILSPFGIIEYIPVFQEGELEQAAMIRSKLTLATKIKTLTVTNVLVGRFSYRRFDNAYSIQQIILEKDYGAPKMQKIDYEERSRKSKSSKKTGLRGEINTNQEA